MGTFGKCDYEGCFNIAVEQVHAAKVCVSCGIQLRKVKITNKELGHQSIYQPEPDRVFDTVSEMKLHGTPKIT